jgi:hypothetical protein
MTRDEAISKVRVERHRLEGALDRFYSHDLSGDPVAMEAEALDVSVPMRVMVHHYPQKNSIALLSHIDSDYSIKPIHFTPTISPPPRMLPSGKQVFTLQVPININMSDSGTSFMRYQRDDDLNSRVPLKEWWSNICWESGTIKVSNKDIVLALANKEGGAHVDDTLSRKYANVKSQGRIVVNGKPMSDVVRIGSLVGIAGDELLEYLRENYPEC